MFCPLFFPVSTKGHEDSSIEWGVRLCQPSYEATGTKKWHSPRELQ